MKKTVFLILLPVVLLLAVSASAGTLKEDQDALKKAETFDQQLAVLSRIAEEHADELEAGGWEVSLRPDAAPGLPEGLIPEKWDDFTADKVNGFPGEYRGHKFIALYCASNEAPDFAGDLLARLPADMRAASLAEAEYALVIRGFWTPSGYSYIPPASSSHRDYVGLVFDLKTNKAVQFWSQRNYAKRSGRRSELSGSTLTDHGIWLAIRSQVLPELSYDLGGGAALLFGVTGKNCYLKGYEGEPADVTVPAAVEGRPVTEVDKNCFSGCKTLTGIRLPETVASIGASAFSECEALKTVALSEGLRSIGASAFSGASSLEEIALPASLVSVGEKALNRCPRLARVTIGEGLEKLGMDMFTGDYGLACVWVPASVTNVNVAGLKPRTAVYAPKGSAALKTAQEKGLTAIACESPDNMPAVQYLTENGYTYRLFNGEAALFRYDGEAPNVVVPESVSGYPVTLMLEYSVYNLEHVKSVTLPRSIRTVYESAIYAVNKKVPMDIYIPNAEMTLETDAIGRYGSNSTPITIHAPEGSLAQRYVTDTSSEPLVFEPWGEGVDPNARSLKDALALAEKLRESAAKFWEKCDQQEYGWFSLLPAYDMAAPGAAYVLRMTQAQYDDLALLMAGPDNVAKVFAAIVNTQWNLPYAKAAAQTAQSGEFSPVADGSCAVAVLVYRSDLIVVTLQGSGSAQAAAVFCSPANISKLTAETVTGIAARYGVTGECAAYSRDALDALLEEKIQTEPGK